MQTHLIRYRACVSSFLQPDASHTPHRCSQDTYTSMTVFVVLILSLFVPLSVGHAIMLRQQMKDAERLRRASSIRSAVDEQFQLLKRMHSTMIGEVRTLLFRLNSESSLADRPSAASLFVQPTRRSSSASLQILRRSARTATRLHHSVWSASTSTLSSGRSLGALLPNAREPHSLRTHSGLIAYRTLRPTIVPAYRRWRRSRDSQLRSVEVASGIQVVTEVVAHVDHENVADLVQLLKSSAQRPRFAVAMVDHEDLQRPKTGESMGLDALPVDLDDEEKPTPRALLVEQVRLPPVKERRAF